MLTQVEADRLIKELKKLAEARMITFPESGQHIALDVISKSGHDSFLVDINRSGRANPNKYTLQERYRKESILVRLDVNGPPHTNPDGEEIPCPHIHIYREGYNMSWAYLIPPDFSKSSDLLQWLFEFLDYCNIDMGESSVEGVVE